MNWQALLERVVAVGAFATAAVLTCAIVAWLYVVAFAVAIGVAQ